MHYMEFKIAMTLSLSNSFIMTKKAISIYCLNSLICSSFPFLFVLYVSLLLGTADAEILRSPSVKPPELTNVFPKKHGVGHNIAKYA